MKVTGKICIALIVIAGIAFGYSSIVVNYVEKSASQTQPFEFKAWPLNMANPNDYLDESTLSSGFQDLGGQLIYYYDCGNYGNGDDWLPGDTAMQLGSWVENGGSASHVGWYFMFSDTLQNETTQFWSPNDTLREIPMPVASAVPARQDTVDSILLEIVNPAETRRGDQTVYDVLGYWVVLDTSGTGVESFFDVTLGFVPVTGGAGASTFFQYALGDYVPGGLYNLYHAYYIVARPETTTTPGVCPGFSTDAMSMNSNLLVVVGVAEHENTVPSSFSARPSVFTERTKFSVVIPEQARVNIKLYDAAGQLVGTVCDEVLTAGSHTIEYNGAALPSGVYFYTLRTNNEQLSGQLVKLH